MARFVPAWGEAPGLKANRNVKAEGLAYSPAGIPRAPAKLSIPGTVNTRSPQAQSHGATTTLAALNYI